MVAYLRVKQVGLVSVSSKKYISYKVSAIILEGLTWNEAYSAGRKGWSNMSSISRSAQALCTYTMKRELVMNWPKETCPQEKSMTANKHKSKKHILILTPICIYSITLLRLSMILLSIAFMAKYSPVPHNSTKCTLPCGWTICVQLSKIE